MAVRVNSEIFRQIISKDNRNNLDILDKFAQGVIQNRIRDIALAMTEGIADWQYKYILIQDNAEFMKTPDTPYNGRAVFMADTLKESLGYLFLGDLPEDKPEFINDCDLSLIDLAGWCKLIRFRFFAEAHRDDFIVSPDKRSLQHFVGFIASVSQLRNEISHENKSTVARYESERNIRKVFEDFIKWTELAEKCVKDNLRNGAEVGRILSGLKEDASEFYDMFLLSINRMPIKRGSREEYPVEYLYGFDRVYLAYPGCRNRDYSRFVKGELNPLMIRGHSNLATDTGTVEYLVELSGSRDYRQSQEAKNIYKDFDNDLKDTLSLIRLPETDELFLHYTDRFMLQLKETEENICVLTDDEYLCNRIEGLPENIVAATVTDSTHVMAYSEDMLLKAEAGSEQGAAENDGFQEKTLIPSRMSAVYYGDPKGGVQYVLKECIGSGGEGDIYRTDIGRECFKIYHESKLTRKRQEKIRAMCANDVLAGDPRICWPVQAVYESSSRHALVGFSMQDINFAAKSAAVPLDELVISLNSGDSMHWNWDRISLLDLCMNIAEVLAALHRQGILVGDINPKNILIDKEGEVFFIDTDSYQFRDYICPVGIPEFTSPRLWDKECIYSENPRVLTDENFAFARLLFYILFLGDSPYQFNDDMIGMDSLKDSIINKKFRFSGSVAPDYIWFNLSAKVRECFGRVFSSEDGTDHPDQYPDESEWLNALYEMEGLIRAGVLSGEMKPQDAVIDEGDFWEDKKCSRCGNKFRAAHRKEETLCPQCREIKRHNSSRLMRVRCTKCGRPFVTDLWELVETEHVADTRDIICPDCNGRGREGIDRQTLNEMMGRISANIKRAGREEL